MDFGCEVSPALCNKDSCAERLLISKIRNVELSSLVFRHANSPYLQSQCADIVECGGELGFDSFLQIVYVTIVVDQDWEGGVPTFQDARQLHSSD